MEELKQILINIGDCMQPHNKIEIHSRTAFHISKNIYTIPYFIDDYNKYHRRKILGTIKSILEKYKYSNGIVLIIGYDNITTKEDCYKIYVVINCDIYFLDEIKFMEYEGDYCMNVKPIKNKLHENTKKILVETREKKKLFDSVSDIYESLSVDTEIINAVDISFDIPLNTNIKTLNTKSSNNSLNTWVDYIMNMIIKHQVY